MIEHDETAFTWYGLHEALFEDSFEPYWIGSEAIEKYDAYNECIDRWGKLEKKYAGLIDIQKYSDILELIDRLHYEDETELEF